MTLFSGYTFPDLQNIKTTVKLKFPPADGIVDTPILYLPGQHMGKINVVHNWGIYVGSDYTYVTFTRGLVHSGE